MHALLAIAPRRSIFGRLADSSALLACILLLTNWPTFHHVILNGTAPLAYYSVIALIAGLLSLARPRAVARLLREPVLIWFCVFAAMGLLWLLAAGEFGEEAVRQWRLRVLAIVLFASSFVIAHEAEPRVLTRSIILCMLIACLLTWADFLFPFFFVPQDSELSNPGRGAGLYINANQAGMAIVAMVVTCLPFVDGRQRVLLVGLMLLGVFPTLSRSTIAFAAAIAFLTLLTALRSRRQLLAFVVTIPLLATAGWFSFHAGVSSDELNADNVWQRVEFFYSFGKATDESAVERQLVADKAWRMFSDAPVFGHGLSASLREYYGRGTHNMYWVLLAEQGLIGGALYLALIAIVLLRGYAAYGRGRDPQQRRAGIALLGMGAYVVFFSLFSHNLLEDPRLIFLTAFLCTLAGRARRTSP